MRRIQQCTTASLFLMTLSAAVETWFSNKASDDYFHSSQELLVTIFPIAMGNLELLANHYFPVFWGLITSTVLQLPLWSIFAVAAIYFSYLLMTDPPEMKKYGKDFENLEMWSRSAFPDNDTYLDRKDFTNRSRNDDSLHTANVKLELLSPQLIVEDNAQKAEDRADIMNTSISEIIPEAYEKSEFNDPRGDVRSAYVEPEIWEPSPSLYSDAEDTPNTQRAYKDEIDEFDEFCDYLEYTENNFFEEEYASQKILKINK